MQGKTFEKELNYDGAFQQAPRCQSADGARGVMRQQHLGSSLQKIATFIIAAACLVSSLAALPSCWMPVSGFPTGSSAKSQAVKTQAFPEGRNDSGFSWHDITPSPNLIYHACFQDFQCARLEVPMDWRRTDGRGGSIALAVTRLPARVPVTDPRYGGLVITNPGGPGGSGVSQVLRNGRATQTIIDSESKPNTTELGSAHKYYDIVSFDPRGVSRTTPGIQCFPDSLSREAWVMQSEALGLLGSSEDSFLRNWPRSKALAEGCSVAHSAGSGNDEAIGEHVNTPPVARDMLEIIERHAEWVEKQGELAQKIHDITFGYDNTQTIARRTRWARGKEKLKYWGNSYGTILGQTFASMFPDRVERLILDGVCDSSDYYHGNWLSNLQDADKVLEKFFQYCSEAGPTKCSFYAFGGPQIIREKYEHVLADIFDHPRSVPSSSIRGPDVITWSDIKSMVRLGMYQPLIFMPMVADLLTDVWRGNGTLFADFKHIEHAPSCPSRECRMAGPYSQECNAAGDNGADASMAILCTDGEGVGHKGKLQFQQYWHALQNKSLVMGDWWATSTRLSCVGWKTKAKWRFAGPIAANTSYPILFIGNTYDPVTPLDNARRMADNFPGSAVLHQNSEGHTSWSSPSLCTARVARAYFQSGEMPAPGTVCEVERLPFQKDDDLAVIRVSKLKPSDRELLRALEVIMRESSMNLRMRSRSIAF